MLTHFWEAIWHCDSEIVHRILTTVRGAVTHRTKLGHQCYTLAFARFKKKKFFSSLLAISLYISPFTINDLKTNRNLQRQVKESKEIYAKRVGTSVKKWFFFQVVRPISLPVKREFFFIIILFVKRNSLSAHHERTVK